jgi:G3E family GTPase
MHSNIQNQISIILNNRDTPPELNQLSQNPKTFIINTSSTNRAFVDLFLSSSNNTSTNNQNYNHVAIHSCICILYLQDLHTTLSKPLYIESVVKGHCSDLDDMDKTVGEILIDNIEFSDAIVLVVKSSSDSNDIEEATKMLSIMNPRAKICIYEEKLPSSLLSGGDESSSENALTALLSGEPLFDVGRTGKELGWFNALQLSSEDNANTSNSNNNSSSSSSGGGDGGGNTIETFVYRARKPFDPSKLWNLIHNHGWSLVRGGGTNDGISACTDQVDTQLAAVDLNTNNQQSSSSSSSSLLRAKGYVWLQGRDWIFGEWDQAGVSVSIEPGGPWFCVLPEDAWPESPEVREVALRDCQYEHGDKRQEIVFIGEKCILKGLKDALDSCLVSTYNSGDDDDDEKWFVAWPSLDELLGLDGGDNNNNKNNYYEDKEDEEEHNMWIISGGGTEVQEMLTAKASSNTAAASVEVTVIHWLAPWVDTSNAAQQNLQYILACQFPSVDFLILDVESSFGNSSLAYQKVLELPAARRANARPVVKNGGKFPCFTVHYAPSLHPAATLSGSTATEDLKKWLVQNVREGDGALTTILPRHPPNNYEEKDEDDDDSLDLNGDPEKEDQDDDGDDDTPEQHMHVLEQGAVQFKTHLKQSADAGRKAVVCWEEVPPAFDSDDGGDEGYFRKRIENAPAPVRELLGSHYHVMVLYLADLSSPNAVLAQAMKVKREKLPCIHVYEGMKLLERALGKQKCSDLLVKLIREAKAKKEEEEEEEGEDDGGVDPPPPPPPTTTTTSGDEKTASTSGGNEWNPPHAKYAKPGGTKRFKNGHLGFFFPKMPCLRCGCPWWSSEEWDARCLRCGWNCERSGYDDDSRPLEKYKGLWERFTREIAGGKTPEWKGK